MRTGDMVTFHQRGVPKRVGIGIVLSQVKGGAETLDIWYKVFWGSGTYTWERLWELEVI